MRASFESAGVHVGIESELDWVDDLVQLGFEIGRAHV